MAFTFCSRFCYRGRTYHSKNKLMRDPRKPELESEIQREILEWLDANNFFFWRSNNIPVHARNNAGQMVFRSLPKFTPKGLPDIIVIRNGIFIALEVKGEKGVTSQDQIIWGSKCERNGGFYHIVRSVEDVKSIKYLQLHKYA